VRWFAEGLTLVRRDLQRRQPAGVKPAFDPDVFRARFLLLQRGDTLNDTDQARLDELFAKHPRLDDRFTDFHAAGQLIEFRDVVDTILFWSAAILSWHDTGRPSNGRVEGTNNLLQVLRRVAHGFTNPDNFAARGLLLT